MQVVKGEGTWLLRGGNSMCDEIRGADGSKSFPETFAMGISCCLKGADNAELYNFEENISAFETSFAKTLTAELVA